MGHRLSKIYTRTGDNGTTGLADGSRVTKDHSRIHCIGAVDEVNCLIGLVIAHLSLEDEFHGLLTEIQHRLFDLGGELSIPGRQLITKEMINNVEVELDRLNKSLPPLKNFVLPGGSKAASQCHVARSVCRRAERDVVALMKETEINPLSLIYLNRLSDMLFVIARILARKNGRAEVLWSQHSKNL